eukprot:gnl/TRDRNA2_/TRDRNA2_139450_c0_seq2.p1 gnl/TRDRNA2_/TRDRNA2_139450_c0~~gnl/TRDRNA2_/TRDRNA2_139450_c0_seq2.p1  ORF type:complete len:166 (+),score=28.84 gnl/TRDRNA2_/TRDRNA2_139450_c0_seq2:33-530(+)
MSKPKTPVRELPWFCPFVIDGDERIPQVDIAGALEANPQPSHRLRLLLRGLESGRTAGGGANAHACTAPRTLGVVEICALDLGGSDLRLGAPGSERPFKIDDDVLLGAVTAHAGATVRLSSPPHLSATVSMTTRNAGRLREVAGLEKASSTRDAAGAAPTEAATS